MVREVTKQFYRALMKTSGRRRRQASIRRQERPTPGALQHAVICDAVTLEQLDAALGNGPALQAFVSTTNPYRRDVTFRTDWDDMPEEPEEL